MPRRRSAARELIGARRRAGDRADADQVRSMRVRIDLLDALVDDPDLRGNLRRHQRGERGQRQRRVAQRLLPDAAAVPVERPARGDEKDAEFSAWSYRNTARLRQRYETGRAEAACGHICPSILYGMRRFYHAPGGQNDRKAESSGLSHLYSGFYNLEASVLRKTLVPWYETKTSCLSLLAAGSVFAADFSVGVRIGPPPPPRGSRPPGEPCALITSGSRVIGIQWGHDPTWMTEIRTRRAYPGRQTARRYEGAALL